MCLPPRCCWAAEDAAISALWVCGVIRDLAHAAAGLARWVSWALEHTSICRRDQSLQNIAKSVAHMCDRLTLRHRLIDLYQTLDEAAVFGVCVVESVGNVHIREIRLDGSVAGCDPQIDQNTVDKIDSAVDERVVPDLRLSHLDCQTRDLVIDKRRLDTAGLANINLQCVGLQELTQALNIGKAPVGVAPQACLAARGWRVEVDAHVDLGGVAPEVVPDVVGEDVGSAATELSRYAREDAVDVGKGAGG